MALRLPLRTRRRRRRQAARAVGGSLLLGAAGTVVLLLPLARSASRPPAVAPPSARVAALAARGVEPGQPALVLGWDAACGACDAARANLGRLRLGAAGVAVVAVSRDDPAAAACGVDRGPFPAWVLLDGDGRVRGARRGYAEPETLHLWVRSRLLEEDASP